MNAIEERIRNVFGDSVVSLDVETYGDMVNVSLVYEDFIPVKDVRSWLNKNVKNMWRMDVERVYSEREVEKALRFLYEYDEDVMYRVEKYLHELDLNVDGA